MRPQHIVDARDAIDQHCSVTAAVLLCSRHPSGSTREAQTRQPPPGLLAGCADGTLMRIGPCEEDGTTDQGHDMRQDGTCAVVTTKGAVLARRGAAHDGEITTLMEVSSLGMVFSAGADAAVRKWNMNTLELIAECTAHRAPITSLQWLPPACSLTSGGVDGGEVITAAAAPDSTVRRWALAKNAQRGIAVFPAAPTALAVVSGQAARAAAGPRGGGAAHTNSRTTAGGTVASCAQLPFVVVGAASGFLCSILVQDRDGDADVDLLGRMFCQFEGHRAEVTSLALVPPSAHATPAAAHTGTGTAGRIISAARDGSIRWWDVPRCTLSPRAAAECPLPSQSRARSWLPKNGTDGRCRDVMRAACLGMVMCTPAPPRSVAPSTDPADGSANIADCHGDVADGAMPCPWCVTSRTSAGTRKDAITSASASASVPVPTCKFPLPFGGAWPPCAIRGIHSDGGGTALCAFGDGTLRTFGAPCDAARGLSGSECTCTRLDNPIEGTAAAAAVETTPGMSEGAVDRCYDTDGGRVYHCFAADGSAGGRSGTDYSPLGGIGLQQCARPQHSHALRAAEGAICHKSIGTFAPPPDAELWAFLRDGRMLGWRPSYEDEFNPRFSAAVRRRIVRDQVRQAAGLAKLARSAARVAAAAALAASRTADAVSRSAAAAADSAALRRTRAAAAAAAAATVAKAAYTDARAIATKAVGAAAVAAVRSRISNSRASDASDGQQKDKTTEDLQSEPTPAPVPAPAPAQSPAPTCAPSQARKAAKPTVISKRTGGGYRLQPVEAQANKGGGRKRGRRVHPSAD